MQNYFRWLDIFGIEFIYLELNKGVGGKYVCSGSKVYFLVCVCVSVSLWCVCVCDVYVRIWMFVDFI